MTPVLSRASGVHPLRVLYVEGALGYGGSGKSLVELVRSIPDVVPRILAGFPLAEYVRDIPPDEVDVQPALLSRRDVRSGRLLSYVDLLGETRRWVRAIIQAARQHRADLVHANNGIALNLAAIVAARRLGLPLVVHQRGWEERTRRSALARSLLSNARVIAISQAIADDLTNLGVGRHQVSQIYDVILPPVTPPEDVPRIGGPWRIAMHGVLNRWKGHDTFLKAAAMLNARRPGAFDFRIAGMPLKGDEAFEHQLRAMAQELGIGDLVHFDGFVHNVYAWMRDVDVSVHASTESEPLGRVIVEAQFAGRPVVAAKGGGARELVEHEVTGLLFEPGSAPELAVAIERLADDEALRRRLAVTASETVRQRFDPERLACSVRDVYEALSRD